MFRPNVPAEEVMFAKGGGSTHVIQTLFIKTDCDISKIIFDDEIDNDPNIDQICITIPVQVFNCIACRPMDQSRAIRLRGNQYTKQVLS